MTVSGEFRFRKLDHPLRDVVVAVRVDDVTRTDARAKTLARTEVGPISLDMASGSLPFSIEVNAADLNPSGRYVVSAHVDLDGDGEVGQGDYVTMESYPILTHGRPAYAALELRRVE